MATQVTASVLATTKITQLYVAMFGRAPDFEGLNFWASGLDAGQTVAKIAQDMFATTPARAYFPSGSSSEQVIQAFYVNVLGRQPDAEGLAFWVARLDALKATGNVNAEGQVVTEIIDIVANYQGNTPEGLESARLFANKIEVANFWVAENGSAENAGKPIALVTSNPDSVVQVKTQILSDFSVGTITLKEAVVDGALQPIRLTTEGSNAGTTATTAGDDTIVAGRLELLHQAYIDGGLGRNTLEIDAKGVYAQPAALLNIQEVRIENLPNVYTGNGGGGYLNNSTYPGLVDPRASSSEIISAAQFNKVAVTANQLVVMVNGQPQAVAAGVYTAETLAAAINAVAGSAVAVVNDGSVSVSGAEVAYRGSATTQIQSSVFNSALITDLRLEIDVVGLASPVVLSVPAGLYTASTLADAINNQLPAGVADVAVIDVAGALNDAAQEVIDAAQEAREDVAAARLVLEAAEAREDAAAALTAHTTAVDAEVQANADVATAATANTAAAAALALANAAVTAATNAAIAAAAEAAALSASEATAARVTAANNAATATTNAAQARSTAANERATDAREALDAAVDAITQLVDDTSAALIDAANDAVTGAQGLVTAATTTLNNQVATLNTLLGNANATTGQLSAAQTAVASAQAALTQANADLVAALQQRTDVALQMANGQVNPATSQLNLSVLQNEFAQAQGEAAEARNALNVAQAEQAAIAATGVRETTAASAAFDAAEEAAATAATAAIAAYNAANPGTDTDLAAGTGAAAILAAAQALATSAQANAVATGAALTVARNDLAAAREAVVDAFNALQTAQAAAATANQAAVLALGNDGANQATVDAQLALTVQQAQTALTAALNTLASAENAVEMLDPSDLLGSAGSLVFRTDATSATEVRFFGTQAVQFGLNDISVTGVLSNTERLGVSVIDLTRAMDLERLVITEGSGTDVALPGTLPIGGLTVVGVRNGAVLRLEGSFSQDVTVHYGAGLSSTEPLTVELVVGTGANGDTPTLNIAHNSDSLHFVSLGGGINNLRASDLDGDLSYLKISGNAGLVLVGDMASSFSNETVTIDASLNAGGVSMTLTGSQNITYTGSLGNDIVRLGTGTDSRTPGQLATDSVQITDTTAGSNKYTVSTGTATVTLGDGANQVNVLAAQNATIVAGNGDKVVQVNVGATIGGTTGNAHITTGNGNTTFNVDAANNVTLTNGNGNSSFDVDAGNDITLINGNGNGNFVNIEAGRDLSLTNGDGNSNFVSVETGRDLSLTNGDGNSNFTALSAGRNLTVVNGDGNATYGDVQAAGNVSITNGDGTISFDEVSAVGNVTITNGNGDVTFATAVEGIDVTVNNGNGNSVIRVDASDDATVVSGNGNTEFIVVAVDQAAVTNGNGNADIQVTANLTTVITGNGDSDIRVFGSGNGAAATITAGNGDTDIQVGESGRAVLNATITSGDGESTINVLSAGSASVTSGNGDKTVTINEFVGATQDAEVVLGGGNNTVTANDIDTVSITVGGGANEISAVGGETVTIVTGNGNNQITVGAEEISVTTGTGNDTVTISGLGAAIGDLTADDTGLLSINVGTGQNTIVLGSEAGGVTALEGSSIGGDNITLRVETLSDLRAATLAGIDRVVLNYDGPLQLPVDKDGAPAALRPVLTLTDTQFLAIGAGNFAVEGAVFNTYAQIKIIVTQSTSLTALGVDALPRNIDLQLEIQDGATLTMTAQQLHMKVAPGGVTLADDAGNTDLAAGKVIITGAGDNFDPFNTNDQAKTNIGGNIYYGGSLSTDFAFDGSDVGSVAGDSKSEWYNVTVRGGFGGYNRPADVPVEQVWTIDGDAFPTVGAHSTWNYNIEVIGNGDVTFTGAGNYGVELGANTTPFVIDFSQLDGRAIGLTLGNFENVGAVYGNSALGYAAVVNVELDNLGDLIAGDAVTGLVSSGVEKYVVTKIAREGGTLLAGGVATINLGGSTQDLEVIALRGNYNDTLTVNNALAGLTFELQGGPVSGNGPNGTANVGKLDVTYEFDTPEAVVNLVRSVTGDTRDIRAYGIEINNADAITINAGVANAIIDSIVGDSLDDLVLVGDRNVSVTSTLALTTGLDSIDASGVDGNLTLSLSGAAATSGFDFVASAGTTTLSLTDVTAGTHSSFVAQASAVFNVSVSGTNDLSKATLTNVDTLSLGNVTQIGGSATNTVTLSATQALDIGLADIMLAHPGLDGTLNITNLGTQAFNAALLGAGVELGTVNIAAGNIVLNAGTVLTGADVVVAAGSTLTLTADQFMALGDLDGVAPGATIRITGLTQAHIDAGFSLDGISNVTGTVTLAENVNLADDTDLNGFSVVLGNNQTLGVATAEQADGLDVTGGTGSAIKLLFASLAPLATIDVSGYNVDILRYQDLLVVGGNTDGIFAGILPRVEKVMYNNLVNLVDQTVTLGEGTIVRGDLAFQLITAQNDTELEDFVLNLQGGTRIEGGIDLQVTPKREDLIQTYLKTLTINSTGTLANPQTGKTANIVEGVITAEGVSSPASTQNELLSVTINAAQALELQGGLVFTSVINDDEVATLNVTGSANVTIGALNTADNDVDGLTVTNNGTGVLTLTLDGEQIDSTDALRFLGTGRIDLIVEGDVNLSDDIITAVDSITLKDGATLQLSIGQVLTLGAANIVPENDDAVDAPTLVVSNLSTQAFDSTAVPDGIDITVIMAPGNITLASVTNLRDITELVVNEGTTLTMTASQATQLVDESQTTGTAPNQTFVPIEFTTNTATGGTINVTGVGQSHLDAGLAAVLQGMGGSQPGAGAPFLRGTIEIVEDVKLDATTLNAAAVSGFTIIGNGAPGLRVDVTMDAANLNSDPSTVINDPDLGLTSISDANANVVGIDRDSGVKSTGISTYVVTALSAQTDVFYVCNDTVGLTTLGLQGNGDDTIYFGGVKRGVSFLLEGDGVANWADVEKIDDTPDVTEIGSIVAAFYTPNNPSATVLINNQGVALGASSTGGERVISTGSVTINNTIAINLEVQDGDAVVESVAGNQAETLNLTAVEDLTITDALPANLDTINATGVTGLFTATISDNDFDLVTGANADITIDDTVLASTASIDGSAGTLNLNISGDSDLSAGTLISVETVKIASGVELTLSAAQVAAIGEADITGVAGGTSEVLNITGLTGAITINEALLGTGVVLGTVTMAAGTHTLSAGTDLTGASLLVPAGGTLTLTADQYMALADLDGIAPVAPATAAVIHITGLTQAHIDAGFTLDNVSNVNFVLSDVALAPTATTVNLDDDTDLNGFGVILSANQTLGLATSVQADGLRIDGDSTNTVVFRFDALSGATVSGDSRIDASKYSIGTLRAMDAFFTDPSALNGEENAEFVIQGLNENVTLVVYTDPTLLGIQGYNRTVIVETGVTVPAEFVFNDTGSTRELIDLTITLQGGAEIDGDLRMPTSHAAGSGARFFDDLVINSTGAAAAAGNVIDGDITPLPQTSGAQNPTSTTERENNLLKVTIAGDKALAINGDIVFNKVGDNDAATTNNNGAATLTVTSTAAVTVGALDTSDNDVTSLTVSNTGGATLSLTIDEAKIDAADALSFTGDNIALTVLGNVDLSNDTLTGLDTLTIGQGATLTLSQAQLTALGAANLLDGGVAGSATLNVNGVNAAFDATTIAAGIDVQALTLAGSMDFAATASNLTGVDTIVVPAGATLTLTAAQFQQLAGTGTINAAGATVNITGLTQADIDSGAFNTSAITAGTITLSLAGNVNLSADDVIENVTSVILANGQTLGLATADQADDLNVAGGTNTTLVFQFVPMIAFPGQINAAGYNVTTLKALAAGFTAGGNSNVEYSIDDLPSAVELRLYEDPELLGFLTPTFRKVVIEAGITTPTGLVFNDWDANDVVSTLSLTLEGGVELNGNLSIPTRTDKTANTEPLFFSQLTLVSSGTQPNVIDGNISTTTVLGSPNTSENNLVSVAINGTQALTINGDITFNKVGNNAVGGGDDATAVLNVNSSAAVTMGAVNTTDDDVTGLTVNNTGTGTLSLTVDAAKIDAADALSFTGDNIALTVLGNVDLSNDNLAGVNSIVISDNSTLTVTQAQFDALGAANFGTDGSPTAVNIVITEFGAAPFDATDLAAGINVQSLVLAASPAVITLDPATNLTDVDQIVVPAGSTLRLTAAQFQQLQGEGTIVSTGPSTAFNVEIYDVRQANVAVDSDNDGVVDAGDQVLNLGSIGNGAAVTLQLASDATTVTFGSFTSTGVSAPAFASDLFVGTSTNLASIQMGNSQSVVFVSAAQADGIRVTGGTSSNVVFAFDDTLVLEANTGPNSLPGNGIDASLYNVTNLRALNVFVDGRNVEQVVENLPGAVNLVVYENPEDVAVGFRSAVNRTVIIEAGVAIDDFVAFIDLNTAREIRNLTIEMQGGTEIDGNVRLATMPQASPTTQPRYFDTLTIASTGATANTIDGNITAQPSPATPSQVGSVENNLLNVVVSGTQNLVITGDIVFSKVGNGVVGGGDDAVANLTITNTGTTTISQLDVSDNDLSGLTIVNNGGLLTVTGASPAVNDVNTDVLGGAGANLETLTLSGTGDITFGLNPNVVTETGIDLGNVSNVNASSLSGNLNLGEVTNIDNANFSFISGTGVTTLTLTSDTLLETALTDIGWNFNFANAAVGSEFHLGSAAGSSLDFDNGGAGTAGSLTINLGNNTTLYIDENTNLTDLDLSILQSPTAPAIVLADGVTLTLTAAQASGLRIVAGTDVGNDGFSGRVQIIDLGNTAVDLSGIAANIAGTTLLEDNDVTLDAATNLGAFSVTLNSLVDFGSMDLSGQTIRFATQVQADGRTILVTGDADNSAGVNSTNVVWLFNTVTGPLDTSDYSGQIGRLWMTQALLSGANVEQLFTTLPNTIVRSEFTTLTQLDGFLSPSQPVDRIVELVAFTNLPNGMVFNDEDALEGIQNLTLNLGGQVSTGNISIDDAVAVGTDPTTVLFNELTINSYRALHQDHVLAPEAYVNDNDGINEVGEFVQPQNINTVGNIRVVGVANSGIDLLTVNLDTKDVSQSLSGPVTGLNQNAGANLVVGTITFDSAAKAGTVTAELNVAGANTTTVASLDASDADIDVMVITNSGTGALTITGASPAVGLGTSAAVSNVEELAINATGNITLGTAGDADKPGVVGDDLSRIEVNGAGIVNLGVIALVDGSSVNVETPSFLLNGSGKANTFAVFGEANVGGVPTAPVLQATGSWEFRDVTMTFTDDVVLGAGTVDFNNVALTISGNVNFTTLSELTLDNTDVTIEVPAGSSLTILAEDADGLTITGDGSVTVLGLEDALNADLSGIMTSDGDTGTVSVIVDTADGADVDALPDTVVLDAAAHLGKAQVSVIGGGTLDVTNVPVGNLQATWNHDGLGGTPDITVKVVFTVAANTTLVVTAAQGDERTATGAGTTNVEDIGLFAGANDLSLAGVATTTVNIAVDSNVTLNSADNLGAAGAGRVTTIATDVVLTAAGSVITGQYIAGENGTLLVDDENTVPVETPITANLSNVSAEFITLVANAEVGTITFPVLYGNPVAKYGDATAIPPVVADPTVAVQTVTLTAVQASGQTIVGANGGTRGEVVVNDLDGAFTNLSNINAGVMTAHVADTPVTLNAGTDLGAFDVLIDAVNGQFTLTAAQADGIQITESGVADADVTVTDLELTPNADLSKIDTDGEVAELDANGGVTLGANLGSNMEVIVSDSLVGGPNTVTFTGDMVSAATTFTIASNAITLVFDANDAHQLSVDEAAGGVTGSTVIVNNVDGDLLDLSDITADTLTANVPADTVLNAGTDLGDFNVVLAEGADLTLSFSQFLNVGAGNTSLDATDFSSAAGGAEEIVTVTGWTPATALDTSVLPPTLALVLEIDPALAAVPPATNTITLAAGTNLSGVEEIKVPAGVTLVMTADQFQQIQHSVTVTGAGTLSLTMFDQDNADIDLSSVTANAGTISLDPAKGATQITAGQVEWVDVANKIVLDPAAVLDNASGAKFSIIMTADNQGITLSSETQADGRSVSEAAPGFADTRLILGFDTPDATDANPNLVATDYKVDNVIVLNTYLSSQFGGLTPANIETFLSDLDSGIPVTIFDADSALIGNLVSEVAVDAVNRTVIVESNTSVAASLAFNDVRPESEVRNLTVNLLGNSVINGNLLLPQNEDPRGQLPTKYVQLFDTLTINSYDEVGSLVSPNVLNGSIVAGNSVNGAESQVEVFTLTLDALMSITGSQDQIGFDGAVINLADGDDVDDVGLKLAAGGYENWHASYDAVTNVVTFTNITAGQQTNVTLSSFTFQQNGGSSAAFPGTSAVAVTQEGSFSGSENNLLNVVINAEHDLNITGTIEFRYVSGTSSILNNVVDETATASLDMDVDAGVTVNIGSLNTTDDHVTGLVITKTGTGTVNVLGTSPAASVGDTETLVINQVDGGVMNFGTDGDATKPGVSGDDLSLIEIDGVGEVNLGVISLVDTAAPVAPAVNSFYLDATGSAGDVTATIGADLAAGGVWSFENGLTGTLNLTINADASFATGSTLNIQGAIITIDGDIDLSGVDLSGVEADCEFFVPAGSILTLTADQVLAFANDSIFVTGEGTVQVVGNADDANSSLLGSVLKTVTVDLSGVTLTLVGPTADADLALEFQNPTATGDDGTPALAQVLIGSSNDDIFLLSNANDTVTGGAGNDFYDGLNGYYTYNVDAGTDTIAELYSDGLGQDVVVVSAGATVIADDINNFVATAATVINGTANMSTADTGGVIDMSLAGGTGTITMLGGDGADTLVGGAGNDTINGGNTTQTSAADVDVLSGGAGADRFNFNLTLSSAATLTVATTQAAIDREVITFTADDTDDGTESIIINYTVNGIAGVALIDLTGVDATNLAAITAAAIAELDAKAGIAAVAGANPGQVVVSGDNGAGVTIGVITVQDGAAEDGGGEPVVDGLSAVASNGTDQAQISTITIAGTPTTGDTYSVVVDYLDGAGTSSEYTAQLNDTAVSVAEGLDELLSEAVVSAENGITAVVTFTSVSGDTGGFSVLTDTTAAFAGSGASDNGAVDYLTADIITDFNAAVDTISFGLAAGNGAINGNYVEAAAAANYTVARDAANDAFDGTVQYYMTSAADLDGAALSGQLATGEEGGGLLFFDANLDGNVDGVVVLLGVTSASFAAANIVA